MEGNSKKHKKDKKKRKRREIKYNDRKKGGEERKEGNLN